MSQAIRFSRYGGPEVLTLEEVPTPVPGPGQVRIAVRSTGVNGIDWKIRRGFFSQGEPPKEPAGTGIDVAGIVDALGPGVRDRSVGQAVFGTASSGAAATHALATAADLVAKPDWLSFDQAAALPVVTETAYRTLRELGVRAGMTVLIHAVAGGVGLVAAQLARSWGAEVIGTAGPRNHAFLREIGVRPVVYGEGLEERVRALAPRGVDAVLDASGRGVIPVSIALAGSPDRVLTIADMDAAEFGVRFSGSGDVPLPEVFAEVLPLLSRGELRMPIERTFPLERTADAQRLSEDGHLLGKVVVTVAADG